MFYSGNDNYMQDLYFYNQAPNNTYNPYMNMQGNPMQNTNMMNSNGMCMGQNNNINSMGMNNMGNMNNPNSMPINPTTNLTSLYPSIYRIINPVVSRVVQNSNYQFLNEDTLNNMVETVYSIVDGQIEYNDTAVTTTQTEINSNSNTSSNNVTSNTTKSADIRQTTTASNSNSNINSNTSLRDSRNDSLLKDLIKILIIKELLARRNFPNGQFNQNQFYTGMPQTNMNF